MRGIDDTDREILRLLLEDARRPYSDIAERVDLSPPAVSNRVDRLRELGVVRSFTLDLDESMLRDGVPVLAELVVDPGRTREVARAVRELDPVEHVFATADARVFVRATVPDGDVDRLLGEAIDAGELRSLDVRLVTDSAWTPRLGEAELAIECVECGNTVTEEGETAVVDGERYHFCCGSCLANFERRYERFREGA